MYSKDSKHRSDSLDEASQFSDLEDKVGTSPAHKPVSESPLSKLSTTIDDKTETALKRETIEFLQFESDYTAQIHAPPLVPREQDKVTYYQKIHK